MSTKILIGLSLIVPQNNGTEETLIELTLARVWTTARSVRGEEIVTEEDGGGEGDKIIVGVEDEVVGVEDEVVGVEDEVIGVEDEVVGVEDGRAVEEIIAMVEDKDVGEGDGGGGLGINSGVDGEVDVVTRGDPDRCPCENPLIYSLA